jgi:hypothetical protein
MVALILLAMGALILLAVTRRRPRPELDAGSMVTAPPHGPPVGPAWVAISGDSDDEPEPVLPEEADVPRWRRPSLQAARFTRVDRWPASTAEPEAAPGAFEAALLERTSSQSPSRKPPRTAAKSAAKSAAPVARRAPRRAKPSGASESA